MTDRGEAVVAIRVRAPSGATVIDVSAILDTGFSGALTLPAATIATLGLARQLSRTTKLGDGSIRQLNLYAAEVEWAGAWRQILIHQIGREVLVGTTLLDGFRSTVDWVPGGTVNVSYGSCLIRARLNARRSPGCTSGAPSAERTD